MTGHALPCGVMADGSIQDMWHSTPKGTTARQRTARYGRGKRWRARITVAGREESRSFRTKEEASQWLALKRAAVVRDEYVPPARGRTTFGAAAAVWLDRPDIRPSTRERDRSYLDSLILPRFGDRELRSITPDDLDRLVRDLTDDGKAPATIRKASQIVGSVLNDAVRRGLLARSPHRGVRLPKVETDEMMFLNVDEVHAVCDLLGEDRTMGLLGAFGGLRLGEVLALRSEDVAGQAVRVRKTATELSEGVLVGPPKTRKAVRTVQLPKFVVDALPDRDGFLFPDSRGEARRRKNWVRRVWKPAVTEAGFPDLRFHDLRHTHVALLIADGVDPKTIAERLGHTSVRTVLDVYGHLFESADREVADSLEKYAR